MKTLPAPDNREDFATWFCSMHKIDAPADFLRFKLNMISQLRSAGIKSSRVSIDTDPNQELMQLEGKSHDLYMLNQDDDWFDKMPGWLAVVLPVSILIGICVLLMYIKNNF